MSVFGVTIVYRESKFSNSERGKLRENSTRLTYALNDKA